jgi:2-amino-4-hydroxy-6-hydroxymethyldihydropteridine diphosphokinase
MIAYLSLGSNLGDRRANLRRAVEALPPLVTVLRSSAIYETEPWGYRDQPPFFNQVIEVETGLPPLELLAHLKQVEADLGRRPTFRYGPRLIDMDILFYADQVVDLPGLSIPHPRLAERAFVLAPLSELAPGLRHPVTGKTILELVSNISLSGVKIIEN